MNTYGHLPIHLCSDIIRHCFLIGGTNLPQQETSDKVKTTFSGMKNLHIIPADCNEIREKKQNELRTKKRFLKMVQFTTFSRYVSLAHRSISDSQTEIIPGSGLIGQLKAYA